MSFPKFLIEIIVFLEKHPSVCFQCDLLRKAKVVLEIVVAVQRFRPRLLFISPVLFPLHRSPRRRSFSRSRSRYFTFFISINFDLHSLKIGHMLTS